MNCAHHCDGRSFLFARESELSEESEKSEYSNDYWNSDQCGARESDSK